MKKRISLVLIVFLETLLLFAVGKATASSIAIDFSELPQNSVLTDQFSNVGVVFSPHFLDGSPSDGLTIQYPGYASYYGFSGITFQSYCQASAYIQTDFSVPTRFVSVNLQPFEGGDAYTFGLELYDKFSNLLKGQVYNNVRVTGSIWGGSINPDELVKLAVTATEDVAFARFYGYNEHGVNAIVADDFVFGTTAPVPEPATILLIGFGFVGLAAFRKWPKK
jgi:hypothetical protein